MKTLLLIAGLPGSGKSSVGRRVAKHFGAPFVDIDDFKRKIVDPTALSNGIDPPEVRWQYYELVLCHVFGLLEETDYVVCDEMFHVGALRRRIEEACAVRGVSVRWVEIRCSDEVVLQRLTTAPRVGHVLSTAQLVGIRAEVARLFDNFDEWPNHVCIENTGCLDTAVRTALERIGAC